ncbi:hypothetical protein ElyMa_004183900 [Elysia marginata]|uniref:SMB domain-containing protein n=1 Tax=Elysia marginata TaxID=1093978 RepID=A0AAV4GLA7_9GAST|nr:hypothetical protein ElyMa_004183900 [Elysia marginata]
MQLNDLCHPISSGLISPYFCFCDLACLAYDDCCWDFHQSCPHLVKEFTHSSLRHARAECIDSYNFLAYDYGTANASQSLGGTKALTSTVTFKEKTDTAKPENIPVSDSATGYHFRSRNDFEIFMPDLERKAMKKRLVKWTPTLRFEENLSIKSLIRLVENQTPNETSRFQLSFFPDFRKTTNTLQPYRPCPYQVIMSCTNLEGFSKIRILNFTLACQSLPDALDVFKWITTPSGQTASSPRHEESTPELPQPADGSEVETFGLQDQPSSKFTITSSTTPYTSPMYTSSVQSNTCPTMFISPTHFTKSPIAFHTLFEIKESGHLKLFKPSGLSSWETIVCNENDKDKTDTEAQTSQMTSCKAQVLCKPGRAYINERCLRADVLLLHVSTPSHSAYADFLTTLMSLLDAWGSLDVSNFQLYADPSSCVGNKTEAGKDTAATYFGLYYILKNNVQNATQTNLPVSDSVLNALRHMTNTINSTVEFCFLFDSQDKLTEQGIDLHKLKNIYAEGKREPPNGYKHIESCQELPWPWKGDFLHQSPSVICETLTPFALVSGVMPMLRTGCSSGQQRCGNEESKGSKSTAVCNHSVVFQFWELPFVFWLMSGFY